MGMVGQESSISSMPTSAYGASAGILAGTKDQDRTENAELVRPIPPTHLTLTSRPEFFSGTTRELTTAEIEKHEPAVEVAGFRGQKTFTVDPQPDILLSPSMPHKGKEGNRAAVSFFDMLKDLD